MRAAGALECRHEGDHQLQDHVEAEARDWAAGTFAWSLHTVAVDFMF